MTISASMVKELRERTGAGMMECKSALAESHGDMEKAIDIMRTRGQAKAAKRAGRTAAEGVVMVAVSEDQKSGVILEANCETDFVGRDASFNDFARQATQHALAHRVSDVEKLMQSTPTGASMTLEQIRQELSNKIGENIQVRRVAELQSTGMVGSYVHGGRIGVLVALDQVKPELAKDLAMHIAAAKPQAVDEKGIPAELMAREKEIYMAQAKESGKPDNIVEKMVEGRMKKFMQEICLLGQMFVKDPEKSIADLLKQNGAHVTAFIRFEVGEGIEKQVVDFAQEVQAQVSKSKE